jgi:hypothetical protein
MSEAIDAVIVEYVKAPTYELASVQYPSDVVSRNPLRLHFDAVTTEEQATRVAMFEYLERRALKHKDAE